MLLVIEVCRAVSLTVDLSSYCPGFHPRGSLDFEGLVYILIVLQLGDIPGEPTGQTPLDSSCIGRCTSEMQSVPLPHDFCVILLLAFFKINIVFVCLDGIFHSKREGRNERVTHTQGAGHITQENYS